MKTRMLKKYVLIATLTISVLILGACSGDPVSDDEVSDISTSETADPGESVSEAETPDTDSGDENSPADESDAEPEDTSQPTDVTVTMDEFYGDTRYAMHLLGLKQYDELKGASFTDTPESGRKYLVLFLQIENRTEKEDYFNTELLEAKLDGEEIENTFLVNDPESYPTIFTSVPEESSISGFVVWKVPDEWQKLELTYRGWESQDHVIVHATLTPNEFKDPPMFEEN